MVSQVNTYPAFAMTISITIHSFTLIYKHASLPALPGEPGGLNVSHRLPTTAKLSWTPVPKEKQNGILIGYTVQVVGPDQSIVYEQAISANATSIEVPNLNPFTLYTFKVSAKTEAGSGPAASSSSQTPEAGETQ